MTQLPPPIRAAMQEGAVELCPVWVTRTFRRYCRQSPVVQAVDACVKRINDAHQMEVRKGGKLWSRARRSQAAKSPHMAALATMQLSGRKDSHHA